MNVFDLRRQVVDAYAEYVQSFVTIADDRISRLVDEQLKAGVLWPEPLVQLNPAFEPGDSLESLVEAGVLDPRCRQVFRDKPEPSVDRGPLALYRHQVEAIKAARTGESYVLTTGTGSGKSLAYIVPIVDHVLRHGSGRGIQAIVVYPMNALANSQLVELGKFLRHGFPDGKPPVTFERYTGQDDQETRERITANPPDIILTNYVMLELLLTRPHEQRIIASAQGLRFIVLDELHTYRGRQGVDVALLVRRLAEACGASKAIMVGTSATLASGGTWAAQQQEVSALATSIFGRPVSPDRVIGESLRRATPEALGSDLTALQAVVSAGSIPSTWEELTTHPLAAWVESTLGVRRDGSGRLVRCAPRPLRGDSGISEALAEATGIEVSACEDAVRQILLAGHKLSPGRGAAAFAFRLHQFLSKGESVYASPEAEDERHLTLQAQQFVPDTDRTKVLLPLAFCRECGQEYYVVRRVRLDDGVVYEPRLLNARKDEDDGEAGFLYINTRDPWPTSGAAVLERLPESWLEVGKDGQLTVIRSRKDDLPSEKFVGADGVEGGGSLRALWFEAPFLFCLKCRVAYDAHQTSDFGKLATLGSEGRSTATSVLTLSTLRTMQRDEGIPATARKLLSFTDNRQDASLQAGHFNDFLGVVLLRSALYRAVKAAGTEGLHHEHLTLRVFDALDLPFELYAQEPSVKYLQRDETKRALRDVLGYLLYQDLERGWRITSPNLEQTGLLEIDYSSLQEFCGDEPPWEGFHPALAGASPEERYRLCHAVLDHLRRELAIRIHFLERSHQDAIESLSRQYLTGPWAIHDIGRMRTARIALPRSRSKKEDTRELVYLSARGGVGLLIRRPDTFASYGAKLTLGDVQNIIVDVLKALEVPGLVYQALKPRRADDVAGYQVNASAMVWRAGDGTKAFHDPLRVPHAPDEGLRTNPFFVAFYRSDTADLLRLEAREHTAQVPSEDREEREQAFREARLPVLFCSPTMELGVDIALLNVVNMRNVPPTPANYAQRSGRAGRSGQPAFVFTYCAAGSPHDQYFFRRPELMVAGAVTPPRLDLASEDALRAHVRAIWLGVSRLSLGRCLKEVLDVQGDNPTLETLPDVKARLADVEIQSQTLPRARAALGQLVTRVVSPGQTVGEWLTTVLKEVPDEFERACERWRDLYRAALAQAQRQTKILHDASRESRDREAAKRLREEAEAQLRLLLETDEKKFSDFYSYRYFASEGFLPGYNFPRLPISAYLPGRRKKGDEEFLSRPRFLAISEFGPKSIIYHEGARYIITKALLPVEADESSITRRAAQCEACGYLHPLKDGPAPDLCDRCQAPEPHVYGSLFRMQNVATRRRDRINSDEEERRRMGFELRTGVRFAERHGRVSAVSARLVAGDDLVAELTYGHAATIWRMNLGWRRRQDKEDVGFWLDIERGIWASKAPDDDEEPEATSPRKVRVIPYVEDHRNCLLVVPTERLSAQQLATLQGALKVAIQVTYELEDSELAAEPLPSEDERRLILLFEATEGGAGALRRLTDDPDALSRVARKALELAHFDPETLEDRRRAPRAKEDCEAACYDCLLSYHNQREHRLIDRKLLPELLRPWLLARVEASPTTDTREQELERLLRQCDSELEKRWLRKAYDLGLRLPLVAQEVVERCHARPDFSYPQAYIFVDGPPHNSPEQKKADQATTDCLEDYRTVLRFHHADDWDALFRRYPGVFGEAPSVVGPRSLATSDVEGYDPEDYDPKWHSLLGALAADDDVSVTSGEEVMRDGKVVGLDLATIRRGAASVRLVDRDQPQADAIAEALTAQGVLCLVIRATDEDARSRIWAGLAR